MTGADEVTERLVALERRVQELQDTLEILRVVASYGPTVDGGAVAEAAALWSEAGEYDSDGEILQGREAIEALAARVGSLPIGAAHFMNLPVVVVSGDRATVTGHSNTFHQEGDRFVVARVSANRWELERLDGGWVIRRRVNRLLDGTDDGRALLREGMTEARGRPGTAFGGHRAL